MAIQPQRTAWTDERLDDLSQTVRDGFARNEAEHQLIRQEMRDGFARVEARFERIDSRFDGLQNQMVNLHRTMIAGLTVIIGAMIGNGLGFF